MHLNHFVVILLFGALVLLSGLKFSNPLKVNRQANFYFAIFLLLWSSFWIDEIVDIILLQELDYRVMFVVNFFQFFTPLALYWSVLYFTNPTFTFTRKHLLHFISPLIFLILLSNFYFNASADTEVLQLIIPIMMIGQGLFYASLSFRRIYIHQKKIQRFTSNVEGINLNWLKYIALTILLACIIVAFYNIFFEATSLNLYMNVAFLITVYLVAYYSLKQKEVFPFDKKQREDISVIEETPPAEAEKNKLLSDEEREAIMQQLLTLMERKQPYLDGELNLIKLAELMQLTPHHLSYVINTGFEENFFQFVNKYRVEKAKELLTREQYAHLTILAIAFESGFNSKTAFNTTFKKFTGQTPSEYKKSGSGL